MFYFSLLSILQVCPGKGQGYEVNKQQKFSSFSNSFDVDIQLQVSHRITESQNGRGWKGPLSVI